MFRTNDKRLTFFVRRFLVYANSLCRVSVHMRVAFWLLIVIPGNGSAQALTGFGAGEMLAAHNSVRATVRLPSLSWSDRLAIVAQSWADHLLATGRFAHRPHSAYGENLYRIDGRPAVPAQVVQSWASEVRLYDHRSNRCQGVCGHYTQIVWRGTRNVGCAVARAKLREVWVCEYDPPGNWVGERPY